MFYLQLIKGVSIREQDLFLSRVQLSGNHKWDKFKTYKRRGKLVAR